MKWQILTDMTIFFAINAFSSRQRTEREQKEKLTKHLTEMKKENSGPVPDKPLFKIKKFSNVAPKVINS